MPLTSGEQIGAIGTGAGVLIVVVGAIVRAATMRGETHNRWQRRVQYSDSALEQREIGELKALRGELEEVLPPGEDPVALSTFDPTPLAERTSHVAKLHASRTRMARAFDVVRRLGHVFTLLLSVFAVATVLLTLYYGELATASWLRVAGLILGGLSVAGLTIAGLAYIILHKRLADAQILSGAGDPPEGAA
jgi:hypothetical protein